LAHDLFWSQIKITELLVTTLSCTTWERESLSSSSQNSASGFKHNKQNKAWKIFKHKTGHRNLLSSNPCISFSSCYNFQTADKNLSTTNNPPFLVLVNSSQNSQQLLATRDYKNTNCNSIPSSFNQNQLFTQTCC
jgi:hypothetical protein